MYVRGSSEYSKPNNLSDFIIRKIKANNFKNVERRQRFRKKNKKFNTRKFKV